MGTLQTTGGGIAAETAWKLLRDLAPALRIGAGWQGPIATAIGEPGRAAGTPALCRVVTCGSRIDAPIIGRLATRTGSPPVPSAVPPPVPSSPPPGSSPPRSTVASAGSSRGPALEFRCLINGPGPEPAIDGGHPAIRWRVTDVPLPQMCIIGDALLIYERPSGPAVGCLAEPVISLLANTFDAVWQRSGPSAGPPDDLKEVLAELATGATDRKAQRDANLSARTFSRKVAELMKLLGATSRFQAGAEAARRGWI